MENRISELEADGAAHTRKNAENMTLKSQMENCELANKGLERELRNLANGERRT